MRAPRVLGLLTAGLAVACGVSTPTASLDGTVVGTPTATPNCGAGGTTQTATFSGAVNTTLNVVVNTGSYYAQTDGGIVETNVGLGIVLATFGYPYFEAEVETLETALQTGTFTSANTIQAGSQLQFQPGTEFDAGPSAEWLQFFIASDPSIQMGAFSWTICSVGSSSSSPHGNFTATLPAYPGSPATGTVTVNVTF